MAEPSAVEALVGELREEAKDSGRNRYILLRTIADRIEAAIAADKASAALESGRGEIPVEVQNAFDKTEVAVAFAHEIAEEFCGGSEAVEECILAKMFEYDMRRRAASPQQAAGERSCCERMREECASLIASCDHYLCNTIIGLKAKPVDSIDQLADKIRALPLPPSGDRSAAEQMRKSCVETFQRVFMESNGPVSMKVAKAIVAMEDLPLPVGTRGETT